MTRQQKMFNEIHREIEPMLEARRVADACAISPLARGCNDGTVASTIIRERAMTEIKTDHRYGYKIRKFI